MDNIEIDFGNDGFKISAEIKMDGNMWCVGIGELQEGLYVFDKHPARAVEKFKDEFRNYKPLETVEIPGFEGTSKDLDNLNIR